MQNPRHGRGAVTFSSDVDNRADTTAAPQETTPSPNARPVYLVALQAPSGGQDAIRGLRGVLKLSLRRFGFRALWIKETSGGEERGR